MLESELFTLLQHTSDAAFSVTEEGEIMSWNKAAEKLFGYPTAEAVHKTCHDILEGMETSRGMRKRESAFPSSPAAK